MHGPCNSAIHYVLLVLWMTSCLHVMGWWTRIKNEIFHRVPMVTSDNVLFSQVCHMVALGAKLLFAVAGLFKKWFIRWLCACSDPLFQTKCFRLHLAMWRWSIVIRNGGRLPVAVHRHLVVVTTRPGRRNRRDNANWWKRWQNTLVYFLTVIDFYYLLDSRYWKDSNVKTKK